jgi:hypothetical protein
MIWLLRLLGLAEAEGVAVTVEGSWPDAGGDKCLVCGVERRKHDDKTHRFKENE